MEVYEDSKNRSICQLTSPPVVGTAQTNGSFLPCVSGTHTEALRARRIPLPRRNWNRNRSARQIRVLMAWWGMVDSGVAIRSQLLLCSPATNSAIALRAARLEPRDTNVTDRVENVEERPADSEARVQ